jgi:ribonucleoside-diphosphate reductase alpha chain
MYISKPNKPVVSRYDRGCHGGGHVVTVIKRKKDREDFDAAKLTRAIESAMGGAGEDDTGYASEVVAKIVDEIGGQDDVDWSRLNELVEQLLVKGGYVGSAKMFLLHRTYKLWAEKRGLDSFEVDPRDLKFSYNALKVCEKRYLWKDETCVTRETPMEMFRRVARTMARVEAEYGAGSEEVDEWEERFFTAMVARDFLPNSPTLMNAGTPLGQLSACFVLPVGDSLPSIFDSVRNTALIHQTGGGTGFSFSRLRPKGDSVRSTGGVASGPISFMKVFDAGTEVIKQGGRRRGANMGILRVDHPDIEEFIRVKDPGNRVLQNFNISVAVTDGFVRALKEGGDYGLVNPRTHQPAGGLDANKVFGDIVRHAWLTGDPGMIFIDRINEHNPVKNLGDIEATNPCGEQPLLPYESCNLGSINLSHMVADSEVNWKKLRRTTVLATRFLDDVIDANRYPIEELTEMAKKTRKIGLGVMGFADMLIKLGLRYDSDRAMAMGRKVMNFITYWSHRTSVELAEERGPFPAFKGSEYERGRFPVELDGFDAEDIPSLGVDWTSLRKLVENGTRNTTNTTIAPTGTISILGGCSSGVEPLFAIAFRRVVLEGTTLLDVHPLFEEKTREMGIYSEDLMELVAETGSLAHIDVPDELKQVFRTAHDISPEWHVRAQGEFQRYTDNAVSKTINLPNDASPEDVAQAYLQAYDMGCKGITVYRDQSKSEQVIYFGLKEEEAAEEAVELANLNVARPPPQPTEAKAEPKLALDFKTERPQVVVDANYSGGCKHCDL